ncbi:hypothetical protein [Aeromicrobium sp.]|uniref:hypothetical protein n=1 Tax=Aeromicrobium sp. TaxID=1871063 RepID=UPI003D6A8029
MDDYVDSGGLRRFADPVHDLIHDGQPFTTITARAFGWSPKQLGHLVVTGSIRRLFRGVYIDARSVDSRALRLAAISLVRPPGAIACNETAAWLHGVDAFKPSDRFLLVPSFVVPHSTTRLTVPGARCRQAILEAGDITSIDGTYATTPLRTASDLLRRLYRPYALAAADAFVRAGLIDLYELRRFIARLKGYPGIVQARSLAGLVDGRAQTPGESWQRLRIHDAGFPAPTLQFEVVDHHGSRFFLDLAYPEILLGSEYDGREFHTDRRDRAHDEERRAHLTDLYGWRWENADRQRLFGPDASYEMNLGKLLGIEPRPRSWGYG